MYNLAKTDVRLQHVWLRS